MKRFRIPALRGALAAAALFTPAAASSIFAPAATLFAFAPAAALFVYAPAAALFAYAPAAQAQNAGAMSCDQLWFARNQIYADAGYCFDTARGRATFGPGCFAPFGKLDRAQKAQVDYYRQWERRRGCD